MTSDFDAQFDLFRHAVFRLETLPAWERVRVVDEPLTDYQRYELVAYQESQAAGEQVRIMPRIRAGDWGPDFWKVGQAGEI